jgi:D-alanine-D-alanine ligase
MKRIAVLRGGPSNEYEVSLRSGAAVLEALRDQGYHCKDIMVTKKGEWLESGVVRNPEQALDATDIVFIALHGEYGEDGQVQRLLQRKNIPFTGSRALSSAVAFNKELTKYTLRDHNILMPKHQRFTRDQLQNIDEEIKYIFEEVGSELFIKPISSGSSLGARYIPDRTSLKQALVELLDVYEQVLIEEYIRGKEATVGVLEHFRNESLYVLPAIEIIPPNGNALFSHEDKYSGSTDEICPGRFSYSEKTKLADAAALVHNTLHCDHYSRSDFIVRNGEVYFLEINTLPGLTRQSLLPKAAAAIGVDYATLITHLTETAKT